MKGKTNYFLLESLVYFQSHDTMLSNTHLRLYTIFYSSEAHMVPGRGRLLKLALQSFPPANNLL